LRLVTWIAAPRKSIRPSAFDRIWSKFHFFVSGQAVQSFTHNKTWYIVLA
jgi:hypothetical protein